MFKKLLLLFFSLPFRATGAALRGATAAVHSLERLPAPPLELAAKHDESDDERKPDEPRDYYRLEVTISPKASVGPFHRWEIGELALVHPDSSLVADGQREIADLCDIRQREVQVSESFVPHREDEDDEEPDSPSEKRQAPAVGTFTPDDGYKLPGVQRLRLLLAVKPGTRRLVFQYYFEKFGEVVLPDTAAAEYSKPVTKP